MRKSKIYSYGSEFNPAKTASAVLRNLKKKYLISLIYTIIFKERFQFQVKLGTQSFNVPLQILTPLHLKNVSELFVYLLKQYIIFIISSK